MSGKTDYNLNHASEIKTKLETVFGIIAIITILVTIPFQDININRNVFGQLGSNLSLIPINIIFVLLFIQKIKILSISLKYVLILFILTFISLVWLCVIGFESKDTNLLNKLLNNIILYTQPLVVFMVFHWLYVKSPKLLLITKRIASYIFFALIVYLALERIGVFSLDKNYWLHATVNSNMRPRLFSSESSMGVTVLITFGLIAFLNYRSFWAKQILIVCLAFGLVTMASKSAMLVMLFIGFIALIKAPVRLKLFGATILLVLIIVFSDKIISNNLGIVAGLEIYPSFTTRVTLILAAIVSLVHYPLGTGLGSYLVIFDNNIIFVKDYVVMLFDIIGFEPVFYEIDSYLYSVEYYSTKSMLFNLIMYFGLFGGYLFYVTHRVIYKRCYFNLVLKILFYYIFLTHIFFVDSLYLYNFWFSFAYIYNYWRLQCGGIYL